MAQNVEKSEKQDLFAAIAARRAEVSRKALKEPKLPKFKKIILESRKSDPKGRFTPGEKIDTREKLDAQLERERARMEPFLADLAPAMESVRKIITIEEFDFRIEQSVYHKEPTQWERVKIPHFGGPLGRAAATYKTTFNLDGGVIAGKNCWVRFKGADYKAQVFVNGVFVGTHEGFFAPFEFDFTRVARPGENELVVRLENDAICLSNDSWGDDGDLYDGDKIYAATGMGWDDPQIGWHHCPPGMGIYQDVSVEIRDKIHIHDLFLRPFLAEGRAELWIELFSTPVLREKVTVEFSIFGQNFQREVVAGQRNEVEVGPWRNDFRFVVAIKNPKPWDLDTPWLYQLQVKVFDKDGKLLDTAKRQFGMRDFRLDTDTKPKGMFVLNGRRIRLRGANEMGYIQQAVAKKDWGKLRDAFLLAKLCNMNYLRITQRPVQDEIYEMCDRLGFMTQTDLPLFGLMRRSQFCEGVRQAEEMERLVRAHPSNIAVTYINEPFPNHKKEHRQLTSEELESFFRACDEAVRLANPDRVIKAVDGDYDPPHEGLPDNHCYNYWYNGHGLSVGKLNKGYWQRVKPGWNYGCGEFGTEGLDPVETMYKYYPKSWLPENRSDAWDPSKIVQAQTARFHYIWFTTQNTIDDWVHASQKHQALGARMMTEAFRRDPRMVSCAIHLFIDAFPSGWMKAIMDVDRNPKPAYFAYREALAPLAANIRMDRRTYFAGEKLDVEFWVCNDRDEQIKGCEIRYQLRQGNRIVFSGRRAAVIPAIMPQYQGTLACALPDVTERTKITVELAVVGKNGRGIHDTAKDIEVFPRVTLATREVFILGAKDGGAWTLAKDLGLKSRAWKKGAGGIILADSIDLVRKNQKDLETAVRAGARLILTDLPGCEEKLELAGDTIEFAPAGMGSRFFVNCQTNHPWAEDFQPEDFFLWHDSRTGIFEPILPATMQSSWATVLATGNGDWRAAQWVPHQAAAVKTYEKGTIIVSLVILAGKTRTNPTAREYARRILES